MIKRIHALLALALLVGACARGETVGPSPRKTDDSSPVAAKQTVEPPVVVPRDCRGLLGDFLTGLTQLDSLVSAGQSAGLQFEAYAGQVGDIRVTYERIETSSVESDCLTAVQLPAERALNRYVEAYNIWSNCLGNGCTDAEVMPKLEAKWAEATTQIDAAETGLATLPDG
jgi:hypothetical protein